MTHLFHIIIELLTNLEPMIRSFVAHHQDGTYIFLFAIIFIETGLIFFPFLPGDSLLFVVGSIAAGTTHTLNIWIIIPLLIIAALAGDNSNYTIGKFLGNTIRHSSYRFIKPRDIEKVESFYNTYGPKLLIMARFMPIVRTIAPFVAGLSQMPYVQFITMSIIGAISWIISITMLGYGFGNLPVVQKHFDHIVLGVLILSISPIIIQFIRSQITKFTTTS